MILVPILVMGLEYISPIPLWMGDISDREYSGLNEQRIKIESKIHSIPYAIRSRELSRLSAEATARFNSNKSASNAFEAALTFGLSKSGQGEKYFDYNKQHPDYEGFFIKSSYEWCRARLLVERTNIFGSYENIFLKFGGRAKTDFILNSLLLESLCRGKPFYSAKMAQSALENLKSIGSDDDRILALEAKANMAKGLFAGDSAAAAKSISQWQSFLTRKYDTPTLNNEILKEIIPRLSKVK